MLYYEKTDVVYTMWIDGDVSMQQRKRTIKD